MTSPLQLFIVSGRSGSGKSHALNTLEDCGVYAVDNLPVSLLPQLITKLQSNAERAINRVAVSVDTRNSKEELAQFPQIIEQLKTSGINVTIVYLDASIDTLVKRFSETRRKHPLSNDSQALRESLLDEQARLDNVVSMADLLIETTQFTVHDLHEAIRDKLVDKEDEQLHITVQSFGFKYGVPNDSDFMFDARCLPNPHWNPELRKLNGTDIEIQDFLRSKPTVQEMLFDITNMVARWLPQFAQQNRSYFTISVGCTGGKHRSVYLAEQLTDALSKLYKNVSSRHREHANWTEKK